MEVGQLLSAQHIAYEKEREGTGHKRTSKEGTHVVAKAARLSWDMRRKSRAYIQAARGTSLLWEASVTAHLITV